jgi:hypothetical protein
MKITLPTTVLGFLVACVPQNTETTDTDEIFIDLNACLGENMSEATSAELLWLDFTLDGLMYPVVHDSEVDGSACINAAGSAATFDFTMDGAPFGTLSIDVPDVGSFDLNSDEAFLEIDLHSLSEPLLFETGEGWLTGFWSVASLDPINMELYGTISQDGHFLSVHALVSASH